MIDEKKLMQFMTSLEEAGAEHVSFDDLRRFIDEFPKVGDWIPCKDRLPEDEECNVLCDIYDEEEDRHIIKIMLYKDLGNCEWEFLNSFGLPQNVVAWQPLPEAYHG